MNFNEYTVTIKRDESYYGDVTRDEAHAIAAKIGASLEQQFPGINVEYCDMIGHARRDDTAGPDEDVCQQIDAARELAFLAA